MLGGQIMAKSGIGAKLPRRTAPGDRPPWRNPGATVRIRRQSQRHVRNHVTWVTKPKHERLRYFRALRWVPDHREAGYFVTS